MSLVKTREWSATIILDGKEGGGVVRDIFWPFFTREEGVGAQTFHSRRYETNRNSESNLIERECDCTRGTCFR